MAKEQTEKVSKEVLAKELDSWAYFLYSLYEKDKQKKNLQSNN